jgi:hypothetical protein
MAQVHQTLAVEAVEAADNFPVQAVVVQVVLALLFYVIHQLTQLQSVQD